MDKRKEFKEKFVFFADNFAKESIGYMDGADWRDVWQWIEDEIKKARNDELNSLLELPTIIDVPYIVYIIKNRIKELNK